MRDYRHMVRADYDYHLQAERSTRPDLTSPAEHSLRSAHFSAVSRPRPDITARDGDGRRPGRPTVPRTPVE
ncbi:hypothetical protein [Streptomyces sp. NPDC088725]|uniref:hypothetical protein n=1 Tax=Streptomyces sp. NPDC088725 TaxID=3365873 RepID=UPI0037F51F3A